AQTPPSGSAPRGGAAILVSNPDGSLGPGFIPYEASEAISTQINGAAAADFNGDGRLDLAVADVASIAVVTFSDIGIDQISRVATTAPPDGIAGADFDGDGVLDMAASNIDGSLTFLRGIGGLDFERGDTIDVDEGSAGLAAGDFDGDRFLDLAAAGPALVILRGDGEGGFEPIAEIDRPDLRDAFANDLDGDEILDLVVSDEDGHFVLGGRGTIGRGWTGSRLAGTLPVKELVAPDAGKFPGVLVIESLDLDRDGALDLAVGTSIAGATGSVLIYSGLSENGRGLGAFADPTAFVTADAAAIESLAAGDFNGDGIPDLVAGSNNGFNGWLVLFAGKSDGSLQTPTSQFGQHATELVSVDLDRDGRLDLLSADSWFEGQTAGTNALFGNGRGGFATVALDSWSSAAVAAGDFDRDGRGDIAFIYNQSISQSFNRHEIGVALAEPFPSSPRSFGAASVLAGSLALALASADMDGDGRDDLVSVGRGGTVRIAEAGGTWRVADSFAGAFGANVVKLRDFNGDRILDVLGGGAIHFGQGDGTLGAAVSSPVPFSVEGGAGNGKVVVADFDDDGILDLAVTHTLAFGEVEIHLGNGTILER
ncbi:MAG: FG-GAP repeat domain-containing protein, partial [Planctomycetota bacterium]